MFLSEKVWLQICEELVKLSVIDGKIYNHTVTTVHNDNKNVILQVETEEDEYELHLFINVSPKCCNTTNEYPKILTENNNIEINIKRLVVKGYKCFSYETMNNMSVDNANLLKSIVKSLATKHSRSIQLTSFKNVKGKNGYPLTVEDFEKTLSDLYEILEKKNQIEVDCKLFKRGVEKLNISNGETLGGLESIYVPSSGTRSKLFFKVSDDNIAKCKIINSETRKCVPLVYDLLIFLFYISTPKMRQHHFHELLEYYYNELKENLYKLEHNIAEILPYEIYHRQIKEFTPYAKVEVAIIKYRRYLKSLENHNANKFDTDKIEDNMTWKTILEIYDSVLYDKLSTEDCYKIVENKLNSCDYELIKWELTPLDNRSGFLGDYYKLKIDVIHNGTRERFNLFAKYLPTYNETAKDMAEISFEKEKFFYSKFITEINSVGLQEIVDFAPNCYFSRSNDVIILEDMSLLNCKSLGKNEALSYEYTLLVTKQLAKLHASSLLYEEIMSEKLGEPYRLGDKYTKYLGEALLHYKDGKPLELMACGVSANLNYLLDVFPDIPKEITMQEFKEQLKLFYGEIFGADLRSSVFRNVVTQGDPWGNNFLFQRDDNDKPIQCYLIDFQLTRYCPPSHEFLFFLYLNTDKSTRKKYMKTFLHQYYQELTQIFKRYNFDFSKIYTYKEFLESCEMIKPKVISLASLYLPFVLSPQEKIDEIVLDEEKANHIFTVDRKELIDQVHDNEFYRKRIRDIVEDLYDICEPAVIKKKTK